jgi:uncharacterized phage protein (TIGR02220 family)
MSGKRAELRVVFKIDVGADEEFHTIRCSYQKIIKFRTKQRIKLDNFTLVIDAVSADFKPTCCAHKFHGTDSWADSSDLRCEPLRA